MRLVFCGTPEFAVPTLEALLRAGHDIALVLSQPDRPIGRNQQLTPPPVKVAAAQAGVPVLQPEKIKNNPDLAARLQSVQPEAIIVVAYGRIIPRWMLDLPPLGNLNLHASLLPKYRGAAPIQWAIANGETVTGATTMRIDEGLDTGDILLQRELSIQPGQTSEELFSLLAESGAGLMVETLDRLASGSIQPIPQDNAKASLAPILKREDALVDFTRPAAAIYNRWRGFQPWPGAYTYLRGKKLTLHRLKPLQFPSSSQLGALAEISRKRELLAGFLVAQGKREGRIGDEAYFFEGVLEIQADGHGLLHSPDPDYRPDPDYDLCVSSSQIREFRLKAGDIITGKARLPREQGEPFVVTQIIAINFDLVREEGKTNLFDQRTLAYLETRAAAPGEVAVEGERIFVSAGDSTWIELIEVQLEGKKRLSVAEFLRGAAIRSGERLGDSSE